MKARRPKQLLKWLKSEGFDEFILGQKLFSEDEEITTDIEQFPEKGDYFSIIHARKHIDPK
jgi:precorrin-2/cobalt-factor-2 C20-methyltransferase